MSNVRRRIQQYVDSHEVFCKAVAIVWVCAAILMLGIGT